MSTLPTLCITGKLDREEEGGDIGSYPMMSLGIMTSSIASVVSKLCFKPKR